MKKVILILLAAVGVAATSCGGSTSVKTQQDSLAYALGVDIGNALWNNFDSTMTPNVIAKGIIEVFAKKANMTPTQAGEYIQYYMSEVLPKQKAEANEKIGAEFMATAEKEAGAVKSTSGLISVIETAGEEPKAAMGDTLTVNYVLYDASGKKLQSSYDNGTPFTYTNSEGAMIAGFSEGVALLGQGGKATLYLPYQIAYGEQGTAMIGPKAALKFEVEVVKIVKPTAQPEVK